jgi:hypothetical protein
MLQRSHEALPERFDQVFLFAYVKREETFLLRQQHSWSEKQSHKWQFSSMAWPEIEHASSHTVSCLRPNERKIIVLKPLYHLMDDD